MGVTLVWSNILKIIIVSAYFVCITLLNNKMNQILMLFPLL